MGYIDGIHVTINIAAPWIRHGFYAISRSGLDLPLQKLPIVSPRLVVDLTKGMAAKTSSENRLSHADCCD